MKKISLVNFSKNHKRKTGIGFLSVVICLIMLSFPFVELFGLIVQSSLAKAAPLTAAQDDMSTPTSTDLQNEGVVRPEQLDEGLSRKTFEDMEGRRVTLRQPYMEVVDRNINRQTVQTLEDEFQFIDPDTHKPYNGPAQSLAKIDFVNDGTDGNQIGDINNPRYPMKGLPNTKDGSKQYFSNFEKYMLLRQAWYYREQINTMLDKPEELKNFLKKHPAADGIYGEISASAKAVSKIIISDPIYRSPLTTGLYLAPGEIATVKIEGLKSGQSLKLTTHQQDSLGYDGGFPEGFDPNKENDYKSLGSTERYFRYWDSRLIEEAERAKSTGENPNYNKFDFKLQNQWQFQNQKVPCMGSIFEFKENGVYSIGSIYGGPLYLQPTDSNVKITITGAVETPHFILGVTTKEEFDQQLRTAPGLIATLDVENGQLIGLADYMKNCDDIEKLAYFWHSVFAINSSLNGRAYNYNITMAYDLHVPAGEAVALNSSFAAQPYGWFEHCMNYQTLTTKGNWGTFHELGHIQAKTYGVNWGMCGSNCSTPCEGEVWNNTLIILMYSMLCNMDPRVIGVEHGEYVYPYNAIKASMNLPDVEDYHDYNKTNNAHFSQLSLYATLIHSFGPDRFVDFFYTYKVNPSYCSNARADFIYRIAFVDHVNILEWINTNYHGNVDAQKDFSSEQLAYLNSLPTFYPIAYEWANGIDGNETARKYDVDGKHETIFDLSQQSFVSLKSFSIVDVTKPKYGSIEYKKNEQKAIYTPPAQICENDQFDIIVCTEGGRTVTLNVRLHLVYNGAYVEVFKIDDDTAKKDIKDVVSLQKDKLPFRTEESSIAGKASFNNSDKEYYHIQFSFKANKAGMHKFTLRGDDAKIAYFKKDGEFIINGDGKIKYSNPNSYFKPTDGLNHFAQVELEIGDVVDIDCHLVNRGGVGYVNVGVVFPDSETVVDIPVENIINTNVSDSELQQVEKFDGWQPKFMDSIKDESITYVEEKDGWKLLKWPEYQKNDGQGKDALLDGKTETYFHTRYTPSVLNTPHEFIIDCGKNIVANYFEILRRGNSNDALYEVSLFGAKDNNNNTPQDDEFSLLFDGNIENPGGVQYRLKFAEQEIRFFKLIVKRNNSQTVIRELSAGLSIDLNQTVKPKNFEKSQSGFTENQANGKLSTKTNGAYYEFEFLGSGFSVFADTDLEYGSANVFLNGKKAGEIRLADKPLFNKCVFKMDELDMGYYNVKIVANTSKPFNISFINVNFATPVDKEDYPVSAQDFGDGSPLTFSTEWRTLINNYKSLTRIDFVKTVPNNYVDTFARMNKYIHIYRNKNDANQIAFVYPGNLLAPSDASALFAGCVSLKEINFSNFQTQSMLYATSMFNGCSSIKKLDLSDFNTENVLYLSSLFENCENLLELDISGFSIQQNAQLTDLLKNCNNLAVLHAPRVLNNNFQLPLSFVDKQNNQTLSVASQTNAGHILIHADHNKLQHYDYLAATRSKDGHKEHDECICGAVLVDGQEVDAKSVIIHAKGYADIIIPSCCGCAIVLAGGIAALIITRRKKRKKY